MKLNYSLMVSKITINNICIACLQKNPVKRITVKEALLHPWIKKFDDTAIVDKRRASKLAKEIDFELFTKNS